MNKHMFWSKISHTLFACLLLAGCAQIYQSPTQLSNLNQKADMNSELEIILARIKAADAQQKLVTAQMPQISIDTAETVFAFTTNDDSFVLDLYSFNSITDRQEAQDQLETQLSPQTNDNNFVLVNGPHLLTAQLQAEATTPQRYYLSDLIAAFAGEE